MPRVSGVIASQFVKHEDMYLLRKIAGIHKLVMQYSQLGQA
jgi:hypothetical protein